MIGDDMHGLQVFAIHNLVDQSSMKSWQCDGGLSTSTNFTVFGPDFAFKGVPP